MKTRVLLFTCDLYIGQCADENEFIVFVWHSNYIISFLKKCLEIVVLCVRVFPLSPIILTLNPYPANVENMVSS
jgi:hypothetical protein